MDKLTTKIETHNSTTASKSHTPGTASTDSKEDISKHQSPIMPTQKRGGSNMMIIIIAIVLITCLCAACCGIGFGALVLSADSTTTNETTTESAAMGGTVTVDEWEVTLINYTKSGTRHIAELKIVNKASRTRTFDPFFQLTLKDGTDYTYSRDYSYFGPANEDLNVSLQSNQSRTGKIAFNVSNNPTGLKLIVDGGFSSNDSVEFTVE